MKKSLIMGLVAILVACVGAAIAIVSFIQKRKCHCDDCCCDDVELYDDYDDSLVESGISEESDLEEKDKILESEKK